MRTNFMRGASLGVLLAVLTGGCANKIKKAESLVSDQLADPDSAKFRDVEQKKWGLICGRVNGKNRLGAYSGFSPFLVRMTKGEPFIKIYQEGEDPSEWIKVCGDGSTICEAKLVADAYPVEENGDEKQHCFPGSTPDSPQICDDPKKAGSSFEPSQLNTNPATGAQTVCEHGGYCYSKADIKLSDACDIPGAIAKELAD